MRFDRSITANFLVVVGKLMGAQTVLVVVDEVDAASYKATVNVTNTTAEPMTSWFTLSDGVVLGA